MIYVFMEMTIGINRAYVILGLLAVTGFDESCCGLWEAARNVGCCNLASRKSASKNISDRIALCRMRD